MQPSYVKVTQFNIKIEHDLKTFFIWNKGRSLADVTFEKDSYNPDEFANASVVLDNTDCKKAIDKVKIKLQRTIQAHSCDGYKYNEVEVVTKRAYVGVDAGAKTEKFLSLNLKGAKEKDKDKYVKEYLKKKAMDMVQKFMNDVVAPSCKSDLINCEYHLKVEF